MQFLSNIPWYLEVALVFVVMMTVLVAAHEYGHYLFARMFGMGVEEFAIGMGKKVAVWRRKTYAVGPDADGAVSHDEPEITGHKATHSPSLTETTEFTIRALPVGGFVRIKGMMPEEDGSEINIPGGFYSKAPWKRFLVLLAGPLFSVLAGLAILIPVFAIGGVDKPVLKPVLGPVSSDGPAGAAGLQEDDLVVSINKVPVDSFYQMVQIVSDNPNHPLRFQVKRVGKLLDKVVTPTLLKNAPTLDRNLDETQDFRDAGRIFISRKIEKTHPSFLGAFSEAVALPWKAASNVVGLFTHPKSFERSVGGPATMVDVVAESTHQGIESLLTIAALLSISVGIMNLLPFVPLDGGQMIVALAEMLRRGKRLSLRVQETLQSIGATLVVVLIMAVLFVDFKRFVFPEKLPFSSPSPSASATAKPSP